MGRVCSNTKSLQLKVLDSLNQVMCKRWGIAWDFCDVQMERKCRECIRICRSLPTPDGQVKDEGEEEDPVCGLHMEAAIGPMHCGPSGMGRKGNAS